jgi:MSHA biogenesis protein MshL
VVVRAFPKELDKIAEFLDTTENSLTRQVILEAKIIEVELSDETQTGINWSILGAQVGNATFDLEDLPPFKQMFSISGSAEHEGFEGVLHLLETQGTVHVLSSPRVSTLNNQKAVIKIGNDSYFVTNVENTISTTTSGENSTAGVDLEPFFSGIALDVTPQIAASGKITLYIHPLISEVSEDEKRVDLGTNSISMPLAKSKIRETDSVVSAENGQIIVLGGLMENDIRKTNAKTPFLSNLPLIGGAFTQKKDKIVKSELVILLRPIVVGGKTWASELEQAKARFTHMEETMDLTNHPLPTQHKFSASN